MRAAPAWCSAAADDVVRAPDLVSAKAQMTMLRLAGFRLRSHHRRSGSPGSRHPTANELAALRIVEGAAQLSAIRVFVSVYPAGSRTTPLTPVDQAAFASYTAALVRALPSFNDVIVGNEPNLNRFWLPQYGPGGENVAAPSYLSLLAQSYDAVKLSDPSVRVWGGALAPRGVDKPNTGRDTHSPTKFITDLGAAYRASGRQARIMDGLAIHPYGENSSTPPTFAHPNSTAIGIADYPKLVALLGQAFDGTAQPGSTLPILYAEYGVETVVPARQGPSLHGRRAATTQAGRRDDTGRAATRRRCSSRSASRPCRVLRLPRAGRGRARLLAVGRPLRRRTPKASQPLVRDALELARDGLDRPLSRARAAGRGDDAPLPHPRRDPEGRPPRAAPLQSRLHLLGAAPEAALGSTTRAKRGYSRAGRLAIADLGRGRVARGSYYFTLSLIHPVNPASTPTLAPERPAPAALAEACAVPGFSREISSRDANGSDRSLWSVALAGCSGSDRAPRSSWAQLTTPSAPIPTGCSTSSPSRASAPSP